MGKLTKDELLNAIDVNYRAAMRAFGAASFVNVRDDEKVFWFMTHIPDAAYNSIMYANLEPGEIPEVIHELRELRTRYAVPMNWLVGPASRPTDLVARLKEAGLKHYVDLPFLSIEIERAGEGVRDRGIERGSEGVRDAVGKGIEIEEVMTQEVWEEWIATETVGFEVEGLIGAGLERLRRAMGIGHDRRTRQPLYHFLARSGGQPVGIASVVLGGGIAGIYDVAVIPAARRRGIGEALTRHALEFARANGMEYAWLQSSPMGFPLYQKIGFQLCGRGSVYG